jgi:hypothetical protein
MRFIITADSNAETGAGEVAQDFNATNYPTILATDYGGGIRIGIVLMCRAPHLNFHRRVRFYKKDRFFGIDVMLDYFQMRDADHTQRRVIVAKKLEDEIPAIIAKRKLPEFRSEQFIADFSAWISSLPYRTHELA